MRRTSGTMALLGTCFVVVMAMSTVAVSNKSAVGTWKLNLAKSSFDKMPAPKAEQLVISTDNENALKWHMVGASADGRTYFESYDGPTDGTEHPMVGSDLKIAYTRNASGANWVAKDHSGAVMETGTARLSQDGQSLTMKGVVKGPKGESSFVAVYERVE